MNNSRLKLLAGITPLLTALLTILAIRFHYGPELFAKWNWFRSSLLVTMITTLIPYASHGLESLAVERGEKQSPAAPGYGEVWFIGVLIGGVLFFLVHPGLAALGVYSDTCSGLLTSFIVIHGFNMSIQAAYITEDESMDITWFIFILSIVVGVILIAGWLEPIWLRGSGFDD